MPYNTTAIPPRREATGSTQLPLSRVRKMIMQDQDINVCANSAAFVITLATEMFIQYMAEAGHNVVKSEKKPRRNIQYRDLSKAVSSLDNLEFLVDVVPRTVPFKEYKAKKAAAPPKPPVPPPEPELMLDGEPYPSPKLNGTNGHAAHSVSNDDVDNDPNAQLEMESREARMSTASVLNGQEDVEMS